MICLVFKHMKKFDRVKDKWNHFMRLRTILPFQTAETEINLCIHGSDQSVPSSYKQYIYSEKSCLIPADKGINLG